MSIDYYAAFQATKLASTAIVSVFGFCLFFLAVPRDDALRNYRTCRKLLGTAYWIFAAINFFGYFLRRYYPYIAHGFVNAHLTLIVASYETLLLPMALVTLVNSDWLDRRKTVLDLLLVSSLSFLSVASLLSPFPGWASEAVFAAFLSYYIWQLITSTRLILAESRSSRKRIDDYFSNRGPLHLGWVGIMGLISNSCGVLSLLMILVQSWLVAFLVLLYISVAYAVLAVKYLNYIYVFNLVAPVIHDEGTRAKYQKSRLSGLDVDRRLQELNAIMTSKKLYLDADLSMAQLSREADLTPPQLSELMNNKLNMNFSSYVNTFRVRAAKALLESKPSMSIIDIAFACGFNSKSNFNHVFKSETGETPTEWRRASVSMRKEAAD